MRVIIFFVSVLLLAVLVSLLASCGNGACPFAATYVNVTDFTPASATRVTPTGIVVDDPDRQISDDDLDARRGELEACLAGLPATWSDVDALAGGCLTSVVQRCISCASVRLAPDWHVSPCTGEQVFSCSVDPSVCSAKGLDTACPCECRATLQDGWVVVTPNLKLYKAELARLVTGCNNPWLIPSLARCL